MKKEDKQLFTNIYFLLKELINKTAPITNASKVMKLDTAGTTIFNFDATSVFHSSYDVIITGITIIDIGGGVNIKINGELYTTASAGFSYAEEEIHTFNVEPAGIAGTAVIRVSAYISSIPNGAR